MKEQIIHLPSIHKFEKINPTPRTSSNFPSDGTFDIYECVHCKIRGKKFCEETAITLTKIYLPDIVTFCDKKSFLGQVIGKEIKIIKQLTTGSGTKNIKIGSIHKIIEPPFGQTNLEQGVFVLGSFGNPVKIFFDEFMFVAQIPKFTRAKKPMFTRNK